MFKVGDKVRIKSDLETNEVYNGCYFISRMEGHKGKIGTITSVLYESYQSRRYILDIDNIHYFSNGMLEPINDSDPILSYNTGDRVRIIDEIPKDLVGIDIHTWIQLLGKSGKIKCANSEKDSYLVSIPEILVSLWFPSKYLKKESTSTSENSTRNISKSIEYVPEIELSYCKKQIYTI